MPHPHEGRQPLVRRSTPRRGIKTVLPAAVQQVLLLTPKPKKGAPKTVHMSAIDRVASHYTGMGYRSPKIALIRSLRRKGFRII